MARPRWNQSGKVKSKKQEPIQSRGLRMPFLSASLGSTALFRRGEISDVPVPFAARYGAPDLLSLAINTIYSREQTKTYIKQCLLCTTEKKRKKKNDVRPA